MVTKKRKQNNFIDALYKEKFRSLSYYLIPINGGRGRDRDYI